MRRVLMVLGVLMGLLVGACVEPLCSDIEPVELHDGVFASEAWERNAPLELGSTPVDGRLEVTVDTAAAEVRVRFQSGGRDVEQLYAITETSMF